MSETALENACKSGSLVRPFQSMDQLRSDLKEKREMASQKYASHPPVSYQYSMGAIGDDDGTVFLIAVNIVSDGKESRLEGSPEELALLFESAASRIRATWLKERGENE